MDLHHLNQFFHQHLIELSGLFTLAVSLWIAFGPLRHRLPRFLTRLGKFSATFKLVSLSGICWFLFYKNLTDDEPSLGMNWLLGTLGVILLCGAAWVVTRKQFHPKHNRLPPAPHPPTAEQRPASPQSHP